MCVCVDVYVSVRHLRDIDPGARADYLCRFCTSFCMDLLYLWPISPKNIATLQTRFKEETPIVFRLCIAYTTTKQSDASLRGLSSMAIDHISSVRS